MKKLEIEKTRPTFTISVLKVDIIKVGLVFLISNFFIAKTSLANHWRSFSSNYLALAMKIMPVGIIPQISTPKGQAKSLEAANLQVCLKPFNFIDFFIEPVYGMRKQVSSSCSRVFG